MSELLAKIRSRLLEARKEKDQLKIGVLNPLLSEAVMVGKNNGNRDSTEEEVIQTIRKFLNNATDTKRLLEGAKDIANSELNLKKITQEIKILESYLPKQLSEEELKKLITDLFESNVIPKNLGAVMGHLKKNFSGQYDGRIASNVIKDILS